jgi:hypothetical protein
MKNLSGFCEDEAKLNNRFSGFEKLFHIPVVVLTSLFLIYCCFRTYYYADDYLHKSIWEKGGLSDFVLFVKDYYLTHGGRALSPVILFSWFFVGNFNVHFVTFFWLMIHFVNCLLLINIISGLDFSNKRLWLIGGLFFAFSWIGMKTHIGYNVYWATGGYMALSGLVFLLIVKILLSLQPIKINYFTFFLFFTAGTLPENASFSIGVAMLFIIILKFLNKTNDRPLFIYFICFSLGFLISFFSPGTFRRMSDQNFSFSFASAIANFFDLYGFQIFRNKVLLLFSLLLGIIFNDFIQIDKMKFNYVLFLLILLSIFLIIPFTFISGLSFVKRAGYFFSFVMSGSCFLIGSYLGNHVRLQIFGYLNNLVLVIFALYIFYNAYLQSKLLNYVSEQHMKRVEQLENAQYLNKKEIYLKVIDFPEELFLVRNLEYSENPNYNDNIRLGFYYGLKVYVQEN